MLNSEMSVQIRRVSEIMTQQSDIYKEMMKRYKVLKKLDVCSSLETIKTMYDKLNSFYIQINNSFTTILGSLNMQFSNTFEAISSRLKESIVLRKNLLDSETKLLERKRKLVNEKQISKWNLIPNYSAPIEDLVKDYKLAIKEIIPKESAPIYQLRKFCGFLYNRNVNEYDQICDMAHEKICVNILFMSKMCRDMAKEVICSY